MDGCVAEAISRWIVKLSSCRRNFRSVETSQRAVLKHRSAQAQGVAEDEALKHPEH